MATLSPDDHFAIERLYARYNHAIHMADGAVWAACFSEDGRFSNRGGSRQGAAELAAYGECLLACGQRALLDQQPRPRRRRGGATGTCYLEILHVAQHGGRTMISLTGIYTDVMTKADGDWKFASRHVARDE